MVPKSRKLKSIAIIACLLVLTVKVYPQTAVWDSTFRPASYRIKVDQFKSYPNSEKDVIFLGNSITAGADWNELLGMAMLKNRGISGDITFGVLERLDEVIEGKPAKVFVLIGINDISRNIPDTLIMANYKKIIRRIKAGSPKTEIYWHTLLPVNSRFGKFKNHYSKDEHILWINKALQELGKKEKITIIDLYPEFLDKENSLVKELTHDGLHLNALGYRKWAQLLLEKGYLNN